MSVLGKTYAITASSWMREGNYIKVPDSDTNRIIYLVNEQADLFELLDEGLDISEIIKTLSRKYMGISVKDIEELINTFQINGIVKTSSQFEVV
jgi:hypothetical protein